MSKLIDAGKIVIDILWNLWLIIAYAVLLGATAASFTSQVDTLAPSMFAYMLAGLRLGAILAIHGLLLWLLWAGLKISVSAVCKYAGWVS